MLETVVGRAVRRAEGLFTPDAPVSAPFPGGGPVESTMDDRSGIDISVPRTLGVETAEFLHGAWAWSRKELRRQKWGSNCTTKTGEGVAANSSLRKHHRILIDRESELRRANSASNFVSHPRRPQRQDQGVEGPARRAADLGGVRPARRHQPDDTEHLGARLHHPTDGSLLRRRARRQGDGQPGGRTGRLPAYGAAFGYVRYVAHGVEGEISRHRARPETVDETRGRVPIYADRRGWILSDQKVYGLWGCTRCRRERPG